MRVVYEVARAIVNSFFGTAFPLPTQATWEATARDFSRKWNYPRAVAAIDGKHFKCFSPPNSGSSYFNFKGYYSVVLLAVADARYRILLFDLGGKGRFSDAGLYGDSTVRQFIEENLINAKPDNAKLLITTAMASQFIRNELKNYLFGCKLEDYYRGQLVRKVSKPNQF
ncbi:hypothetical protein ANCCAN_11276 [Ancylostoma caninum]|uniref:DDE Tnp4 domain-containing protein n=1 Tax=Ancylostoma caninum TaxID=29170 RepID=A0A368GGD3_ANCCA|nr:hypothetical protein ANCCAN_11276 [Ancylostoma caninum]